MKLSLLLTAGLALAATSAFAQTMPSPSSSAAGTAPGTTPAYSKSQPTPLNSTTDHMGDMNGTQTSGTMTKRQMSHSNKGMVPSGHKTKTKADGPTKTTM